MQLRFCLTKGGMLLYTSGIDIWYCSSVSGVVSYTNFRSRAWGGKLDKSYVIIYPVKRTVATLFAASESTASTFCWRH